MPEQKYCKRLIEVDLPIAKISYHALKDQNVRKGHLHTMHVWWATRPLAACRAVLMTLLLPDPTDPQCDDKFRQKAREVLSSFTGKNLSNNEILREILLNFVADFSDWNNSNNQTFVQAAQKLVNAAHPNDKPFVIDPFAGGGSIPFEALRIGVNTFAGDLNPVSILINKVALEYLPKYKQNLADAVYKWGNWIYQCGKQELKQFYPEEPDGGVPLVYIWARTIKCEGPGCGAQIPLVGLLRLSNKEGRKVALRYKVDFDRKEINFEIFKPKSEDEIQQPIVKRFSATCPVCSFTTAYKDVRKQIKNKRGGTNDARLLAVTTLKSNGERGFRIANDNDLKILERASQFFNEMVSKHNQPISLAPQEPLPPDGTLGFRINKYGMTTWGDLFTCRQKLALATLTRLVSDAYSEILKESKDSEFSAAVTTCLGLIVSNLSHYCTSVSYNHPFYGMRSAFGGNGFPMKADFGESNPFLPKLVGGFEYSLGNLVEFLKREGSQNCNPATIQQASATSIPLPDDSVSYVFTDPPYYDAIPYSSLSDLCYIWLKRSIAKFHPDLFRWPLTPKAEECILDPGSSIEGQPVKDKAFFENTMQRALADCRRVLKPNGVGVVVFAHKGTAGWEALLNALVNAGWMVTASWPIDTERAARLRAKNSAVLASSVHLVCRPRENPDGSLTKNDIGDWRDILQELPKKIHEWMPRLAKEGVVGADAIFSCLGPALEVFSKYSHVEKANGEKVKLSEYLEQVWAAVAKEALNMIFEGARTEGFEEDARLTAMWLWTLSTGTNGNSKKVGEDTEEIADENESGSNKASLSGFSLEFDAARKIAQGLGAHLENLDTLVEIEGEKAHLLSVAERVKILFGKDSIAATAKRKKKDGQMTLFPELEKIKDNKWSLGDNKASVGKTILDRLHQAMILFGAGRSEALRRFLVEEGVGKDDRFWRLAQALSALYPHSTDEKRWVDGVLAKKKSFGF